MTTLTTPSTLSTPLSRTRSLARAEWLQFTRNRTILGMAVIMPLLFPLAMFFFYRRSFGVNGATSAALEIFLLFALLFVQFYAVLSMATTRRDERVLKRLRTGEAADREILVAICTPAALVIGLMSVVMAVVLLLGGAPAPVNVVPLLVALVLGVVVSAALGLLTSAFTRNAEAAQVTSMPVFVVALASMAALRDAVGGLVGTVLDLNPFALVLDLAQLGWMGSVAPGDPALGFGAVFAEAWLPMLVLCAWAVAVVWAAHRHMRWDSHR